ncbi:hypothetical protein ABT297_03995 [Dactylosporangium sp. NPDC000555]|uniref:hypothetical protein n=1 Tax=Dactylosporangium sp. NPDC000555 TaxID=3154260 RepID=UPI0033302B6C
MKRFLQRFGKAAAAVLVAALTIASSAVSDGHIDAGEGIQIAIAATTAFSVWFVPNLPSAPAVKTVVAVVLAVLNAATAYIVGGLDTGEIVNLVIAGLGVLLIGAAPAQSIGDNLVPRPVAAAMSRQAYGGS